jgi:ubiquinone/menaquinone biosynthesis C-methylase UbiE
VDRIAADLVDEYRKQRAWRPWPAVFRLLPDISGQVVLDLGCGVGDQAAELAARGATVIAIDSNDALLEFARARAIPRVEFRNADIAHLELATPTSGIWCSFAAAYLPDLVSVLRRWQSLLTPGGWILVTEVDDLFAHGPTNSRSRELLTGYTRARLDAGRYDFQMGRKLRGHLEEAGFVVQDDLRCEDEELAFQGPATEEVVAAWRARFKRLRSLQEFCGVEFESVATDFLRCLAASDHHCGASIRACIARYVG